MRTDTTLIRQREIPAQQTPGGKPWPGSTGQSQNGTAVAESFLSGAAIPPMKLSISYEDVQTSGNKETATILKLADDGRDL